MSSHRQGTNPWPHPGMGPGSEKGSLQAPAPRQAPFLSWQSESIPDALCYEDSDCPPGEPVVAGNGEAWSRHGWGQKGSWNQEVPGIVLLPPLQE